MGVRNSSIGNYRQNGGKLNESGCRKMPNLQASAWREKRRKMF
jgi:hypothetical protein